MAHDTEWFEALTVVEAKEERIVLGLFVCRVVILLALLCVVANAAWNVGVT
jgi:hypothetical protein